MREVKIGFISFSVYLWKIWLRHGGLSIYGSQKGDEGADTDLMFQFCLPYNKKRLEPLKISFQDLLGIIFSFFWEDNYWYLFAL